MQLSAYPTPDTDFQILSKKLSAPYPTPYPTPKCAFWVVRVVLPLVLQQPASESLWFLMRKSAV